MAVWSWPFLVLLCVGNVKLQASEQLGREKRQISYPQIYQTVKECIEEANNELAIQKQIDKYMMDTGKSWTTHRCEDIYRKYFFIFVTPQIVN